MKEREKEKKKTLTNCGNEASDVFAPHDARNVYHARSASHRANLSFSSETYPTKDQEGNGRASPVTVRVCAICSHFRLVYNASQDEELRKKTKKKEKRRGRRLLYGRRGLSPSTTRSLHVAGIGIRRPFLKMWYREIV